MLAVGEDVTNKGSFNLYRSDDVGKTFEVVDLTQALDGGSLQGCAALYSVSELVHFLGTRSGDLLASEDGGKVWKRVQGVQANADIRKIVGAPGAQKWTDEYDLYFMTEDTLELASIQKIDDGNMHLTTQTMRKPEADMGFLNVIAHRGAKSTETNLFLMQSGCASNDGCNRTLLTSQDSGNNWNGAHAEHLTEKVWDDHIGDDYSTKFLYEEFYDAWGVPGTDIVFLGSFGGIFRSDDNGRSWTVLDTLNHWITGLSVGPANGEGYYFLDVCTYTQGCFGGRLQISQSDENIIAGRDEMLKPLPWGNPSSPQSRYEIVAISPNHHNDGLVLRSTYRPSSDERLQRSFDNFVIDAFVKIPALDDNGDRTVVHSIVFSPDFTKDKSIFVSGHNIGLTVSENKGATFDLLWDPRDLEKNGTVTTIALSPHYETDGIIALLVDNYAQWGHTLHRRYGANVYLSENRGSTWRKLTSQAQPWMNLVAVSQKGEGTTPVLIAVHQDGSLNAWTGEGNGTVWETVLGSTFPNKFPDGYSVNGVVASPGGQHLIAAFQQGGAILFDDFNVTTRRFNNAVISRTGLYLDTSLEPDMKFVYEVRKNWERGVGDTIAFSPNYEEDGTIFATSFYSIYASVDHGVHWKEIFRLPHKNTKSWEDLEMTENRKTAVKTSHQHLLLIAPSILVVLLSVAIWISKSGKKKPKLSEPTDRRYSDEEVLEFGKIGSDAIFISRSGNIGSDDGVRDGDTDERHITGDTDMSKPEGNDADGTYNRAEQPDRNYSCEVFEIGEIDSDDESDGDADERHLTDDTEMFKPEGNDADGTYRAEPDRNYSYEVFEIGEMDSDDEPGGDADDDRHFTGDIERSTKPGGNYVDHAYRAEPDRNYSFEFEMGEKRSDDEPGRGADETHLISDTERSIKPEENYADDTCSDETSSITCPDEDFQDEVHAKV
jgi:photosystem II stability/assembly factor-like uncharacterized protein